MTVGPADLATYLGTEVDETRAAYVIQQALNLCLSMVDLLPQTADPVVLDVAARAYTNPSNVQSQGVGPYNASYGGAGGGLYLTRQNKVTLRRLAGGSAAYSIDPVDPQRVAKAVRGLPFWDWDSVAYASANEAVPTGAVAGAPGYFTPAGVLPPATYAELLAAQITPNVPLNWSTFQFVSLGDGSTVYWASGQWVVGVAPITANGAVPGAPGYFTPAGTHAPADLAALDFWPSPSTDWTEGQFVLLADGSQACWFGSQWIAGRVPPPAG